jgi:hypothetical protein
MGVRAPSPLGAWAQLAALSSLVVAQPLFDLLGRNAEFFVVRGSGRSDILVFAAAVVLIPPTALLCVEVLVGLAGSRARAWTHVALVGILAAALVLEVLARTALESPLAVPAALAAGALAAAAYVRWKALRAWTTYLAPAPLVFLVLFLVASPVGRIVFPSGAEAHAASTSAARTPVVLVVFDELPIASLLGTDGGIDAEHYPSFAALARGSSWYRWTTSPSGDTTEAVPAILTGRKPDPDRLPFFSDHPDNLFTLLGRTHSLHVAEPITHLCPERLCPAADRPGLGARLRSLASDAGTVYLHILLPKDQRERLPPLVGTWMDFRAADGDDERGLAKTRALTDLRGRVAELRRYVGEIHAGPRPAVHFLHVLLPHHPWEYLPSGERYARPTLIPGLDEDGRWEDDDLLVEQAWQRHLLQVGFVDRLLGEVVARLRATGLYDRALLVVTADHGVSFQPGIANRRLVPENRGELGLVPLFVKRPGQTRGRVVDAETSIVDVLPTIASVLGVEPAWPLDGRPAAQETPPPDGELVRQLEAAVARKEALFGADLYALGPHPDWLGRPVPRAGVEPVSVRFLDAGLRQPHVVARVAGLEEGDNVLVAADGRAAAFGRTFRFEGRVRFEALLPPWAARSDGLAVLRVDG